MFAPNPRWCGFSSESIVARQSQGLVFQILPHEMKTASRGRSLTGHAVKNISAQKTGTTAVLHRGCAKTNREGCNSPGRSRISITTPAGDVRRVILKHPMCDTIAYLHFQRPLNRSHRNVVPGDLGAEDNSEPQFLVFVRSTCSMSCFIYHGKPVIFREGVGRRPVHSKNDKLIMKENSVS